MKGIFSVKPKAWFPLNVSVLETNRSSLLVWTLLRFVVFHRQPSSGLLRGLLYLEVCKSRSASGIGLKITTFRKSPLYLFVLSFALFFWRTENIFVFCVRDASLTHLWSALSVRIGHSHSISRHKPLQNFNMCDLVANTQVFVAKAGIACDHWCSYIERHRALLCVLLIYVWKQAFNLYVRAAH